MVHWTYHWVSKTDGNTGPFVFSGKFSPNGSLTGLALDTNGLSSHSEQSAKNIPLRPKKSGLAVTEA
jgi:hypothetical protein